MNPTLKKNLALVFLTSLVPFTFLAILSIWDFVGDEVIWRSMTTIVVLAAVTALAMAILSFIEVEKKTKQVKKKGK